MCNHLHPRQAESQMEIVLCEDEDCDYQYLPQCFKCAFKQCKSHFVNCKTGDRFQGSRALLQQKHNELEMQFFNLNQKINQKLALLLQQTKYIINKVEQFCDNGFFEDIVPFNFNIDYIIDVQKELVQDIDYKFEAVQDYINEFNESHNLFKKKESKKHQKYSIMHEFNNNLVKALETINDSLKMDPLSLFSLYQKGNILLKQQQYDEAYKYLLKAFLLSKMSKKKELKNQIFLTLCDIYIAILEENCYFKMKQYNFLIELQNQYSNEFDEKKVSMFKAFAEFNRMEYKNAINSLKEMNQSQIADQKASKFWDLCSSAERIQTEIKEQSELNSQEMLKDSLQSFSNFNQKKSVQNYNQTPQTEIPNPLINILLDTLQKYFTITLNQDENDINLALFNQKQQYIIQLQGNEIHIVNLKSFQTEDKDQQIEKIHQLALQILEQAISNLLKKKKPYNSPNKR
ncbi:unnamed protein product (macronuclear) [Paramecium tetraurelia]|uniref:Uncharacterized protein n=1 Tax=Paramecium tetraurelia TaxID=5888 RepID=A0BQ22_PARTE|nr:uncharacterized protein GSPATT00005390001 [Paramecium tetraurelia]CAK60639.1 unnamed protein product [Paramecium tetraurelia]|eukprot:XP_001428037.1 hypothetical protein (macronuclear) [Paramecium tetraurelia strain d4-2]